MIDFGKNNLESMALLRRAADEFENPIAQIRYASAVLKLGNTVSALESLNSAAENPLASKRMKAEACYRMAQIYDSENEIFQAQSFFNRAAELESHKALCLVATDYLRRDMYGEAIEHYYLSAMQGNESALEGLVKIKQLLGNDVASMFGPSTMAVSSSMSNQFGIKAITTATPIFQSQASLLLNFEKVTNRLNEVRSKYPQAALSENTPAP